MIRLPRLPESRVLAAAALSAMPTLAAAQTDSTGPVTLDSVTVIANPIIEQNRIDPFSGAASIVSDAQIRDLNAVDLASALRRTPGVQISRFNPVGAFGGAEGGGIYIRGMGQSRPGSEIKTYIDGVPVYMGVWNHPLLDLLPVNGMESITVYKSPQPQIFGNNFAAVELATRRATSDGTHGSAQIGFGSFGTFIQKADLVGRQGNIDYMLAQGYSASSGHRAHADGQLANLMGRLGWQITPNWRLSGSFLYADNKAHDPGDNRLPAPTIAPRYDTRAMMLSAALAHRYDGIRGEVKLYTNQGIGAWLSQPAPDGDTKTRYNLTGVRWFEEITPWSGGLLRAGIDHDLISGRVDFNRVAPAAPDRWDTPTLRITSPYVAASQRVPLTADWALVPALGVRFYTHNVFKAETAPHAGLSLTSETMTVYANAARGVNYPGLEAATLSRVIPALGTSWRTLSAESLDHYEIGAKLNVFNGNMIDIALFTDHVRDRYVFGFPPTLPPPPKFLNLGKYHKRGAELTVQQDIGKDWSVTAGVTLLDPSVGNLPYMPRTAISGGVNGRIGDFRVALDAQYQSATWALNQSRTAGVSNTSRVPGFTVVNARIAYPLPRLGRGGELFVAVENLLDARYGYRPGYDMPGIWGQIGLSAGF